EPWALAFHVGQIAVPEDIVARGEALWSGRADLRAQVPDLAALVAALPGGFAGLDQADADALTAYLRRHPEAVVTSAAEAAGSGETLALARARLDEGMAAYAAGDARAARDKFLSSYLDGFEPVEPMLATRDRKQIGRAHV